jgi:7,8-dihydropterin-6-yl-methyl-4-(beta-D-ribofuranosyl)aminobenzene 5'-phosphate synthase
MGALVSALGLSSSTIPVYIHPAAFAMRRKRLSDGSYTDLPALTEDAITDAGGILVHVQQPTGIGDETMLLTGEIERTTAFEQGSPILEVKEGDSFVRDVFRDDQSLIMHLKGEGLVIVSGCAHAGIINSIRYAQKITGVQKIHAVIGGFHLSGPYFKEIIPQTVAAFQQINPAYIIPVHCTGWGGTNEYRNGNAPCICAQYGWNDLLFWELRSGQRDIRRMRRIPWRQFQQCFDAIASG